MVRAELEAAHLVGIHEEGRGSVKGWCHGAFQVIGIGFTSILAEAEKEGQLNSEIRNSGIEGLRDSGIEEL
jgi:hypothetical protein